MIGITEAITPIELMKKGVKSNKQPWALYGCRIMVDGVDYGASAFSKLDLEQALKGLLPRDKIEFKFEVRDGKYKNILLAEGIKVLEKNVPVGVQPLVVDKVNRSEKPVDWDAKELRMIAQNALRHADEWAKINASVYNTVPKEEEYFAFAKKCIDFVYKLKKG